MIIALKVALLGAAVISMMLVTRWLKFRFGDVNLQEPEAAVSERDPPRR